jgi:hypothetical protein
MSYFKSALVALLAVSLSNAQPEGGFRGGNGSGLGPGGSSGPGGRHHGGMHDADSVNITCESEIGFSCDLLRDEEEEEGVFVCRTYTNHMTGLNNSFPVCIPTDKAWESDECGCCDDECPEACDACPCTFTGPDCEEKEGVEIFVAVEQEPMCVPKGASRMMMSRKLSQNRFITVSDR